MALEKAKVLVVSSVKGGTGKTTTVLNLAGIYSLENKKVLIMDLDLFSGGIAASLNVSDSQDIYKLIDTRIPKGIKPKDLFSDYIGNEELEED